MIGNVWAVVRLSLKKRCKSILFGKVPHFPLACLVVNYNFGVLKKTK